MPKAYWIARVDVHDPEGYKAYVAANAEPFRRFGAKFLARGGRLEALEGKARARNVVIEFKDMETALACYNSPEYQAALKLRLPHSEAELCIVEGYEGPQPA